MYIFKDPILQNINNSKIFVSNDFQTSLNKPKSKTIEFFKDLYTYPPKFKVIWNDLDELNINSKLSSDGLKGSLPTTHISNRNVSRQDSPFMDVVEVISSRLANSNSIHAKETRYLIQDYVDGYINKSLSENFYKRKTNLIQNSLKDIPVYTIFNGRGEIILAHTNNIYTDKKFFSEKLYDFCGAFDVRFTKNPGLGLFFMNRKDAETYLKEIAQTDSFGTKMVGLSIHCVGLDFAYRVTRNFTPDIEFRFVPDINEIRSLLNEQIHKGEYIFENSQQQLRLRRRPVKLLPNIVPGIRTLEKSVSPFSSFLQKSEYFKGVPIYFVQVHGTSRNFFVEQVTKVFSTLDLTIGKVVRILNYPIGYGHCWLMQGSIDNSGYKSNNIQNYIFLNSLEALDFCKRNSRQVIRFNGNQIRLTQPKPKIFVFNLEDFLELWEEKLKNDTYASSKNNLGNSPSSIFNAGQTHFIANEPFITDFGTPDGNKLSLIASSKEFLRVKFKTLKGFGTMFLNNS
jgi:hypothetical protein